MDMIAGITSKDIILLVMGALIALPITAGWNGIRGWFRKKGEETDNFRQAWQVRLKSNDKEERDSAFREIIVRASYNFILGNMMFAFSGMAWIGDFLGIYPAQSMIAVIGSVAAAVYFLLAAKWVNLYRISYDLS